LRAGSGVGRGIWCSGVEDVVNDVNNTLLDKHVGDDHLGAVDKDIGAINCDGEGLVGQSSQFRAVGEKRGVADDVRNDVVAENALQLLDCDVQKSRANGLEGSIVGDKDSRVLWESSMAIVGYP